MCKEEGRKIKELLEQYEDSEIRNSEMQAECKENQFEPSEEFKEAMERMFEDVPRCTKVLWYRKLRSSVAFACAMLSRAAILAVLLLSLTGVLPEKGLLAAPVNQIVLLTEDTENAKQLDFCVHPLQDPDKFKTASELTLEFPYMPEGYEFKLERTFYSERAREIRYAKGEENEIFILARNIGKGMKMAASGAKYSVFWVDGVAVTKLSMENGYTYYTWVQSGYLFDLGVKGDLQEEIEQIIASINIS